MRIYRLSPRDTQSLSPREILSRFSNAFAYVESDVDDADSLGTGVIRSYRETLGKYSDLRQKFDWLPEPPPPIEEMQRIWCNAIHMHVWLDPMNDQRFSAIVNNDQTFELVFSDTVSTKLRRDLTNDAAHLLEYSAEIVDEPDYIDPSDDYVVPSRKWWKFRRLMES